MEQAWKSTIMASRSRLGANGCDTGKTNSEEYHEHQGFKPIEITPQALGPDAFCAQLHAEP